MIIYNVTESANQDPKARADFDIRICDEIVRKELKIDVEFIKIFRLGEKSDNKIRPILVCFRGETQKWRVLKAAKELRNSDKFKNIFIAKDMTSEEREIDKGLREELRLRKQNGEDCQIKNGQIITKNSIPVLGDYIVYNRRLNFNRGMRGRDQQH